MFTTTGGNDNFAADRAVAEHVAAAYPDIRIAVRLLTSSPDGATAYIDADLRATPAILQEAAGVLDFGQPVAVMLLGILQGIPDEDEPGTIIARLMEAVPSGSYLAVTQIAGDVATSEVAEGVQRYNEQAAVPVAARTHAQVCQFFTGLNLLEPGVVQVHRWRAGAGDLGKRPQPGHLRGVGRKP